MSMPVAATAAPKLIKFGAAAGAPQGAIGQWNRLTMDAFRTPTMPAWPSHPLVPFVSSVGQTRCEEKGEKAEEKRDFSASSSRQGNNHSRRTVRQRTDAATDR